MEKCDVSRDSCPHSEIGLLNAKFRRAVNVVLLAFPVGCAPLNQSERPITPSIPTVYVPAVDEMPTRVSEPMESALREETKTNNCLPAAKVSYQMVKDFHENLAVAEDKQGFLFIDSNGNPVSEDRFDYADSFRKGLAPVNKNGELYFVDHQMNRVERPKDETQHANTNTFGGRFDAVGEFSDGLAEARIRGIFYFVDKDGNIVFQEDPKWIYFDFNEGFAAVSVRKGQKASHVNQNGQFAYPDFFDYTASFREGSAVVKKQNKWFHIQPDGKPAYAEKYDYVGDFSNGIAVVRLDQKWFHIQPDGRPVYSARFDYAGDYSEDMAAVRDGSRWYHISRSGTPYPNRKNCPKE